MELNLADKNVAVTGSAAGIGMEIARGFLREGAKVTINGITDEEVDAAMEDLSPEGEVTGVVADLSSAEGAENFYAKATGNGDIDVLVNNVGIFKPIPFEEISDEDWLLYFQVNVMSSVRLSRLALPGMLERNQGRIIMIASEAGIKPIPRMIHYSVSKTALIGLGRGLAELTKNSGVTVNSLLPGPTWTVGVENYFQGLAEEENRYLNDIVQDYFKKEEPTSLIQRFIQPQEIADAVLFLSSTGAVNGAAMRVEGGLIRSI